MLPLLIGLGTAAVSEWQRQKRQKELDAALERSRPPQIDFGTRRNHMISQAGENRNAAARGLEGKMAASGVNDPGAEASATRAGNVDMAHQIDNGMANIQDQQDAYNRAVAAWEAEKAGIQSQQPDVFNSVGEGLQAGMQADQIFNPQRYVPQYGTPPASTPSGSPALNFGSNPPSAGDTSMKPPRIGIGTNPPNTNVADYGVNTDAWNPKPPRLRIGTGKRQPIFDYHPQRGLRFYGDNPQ